MAADLCRAGACLHDAQNEGSEQEPELKTVVYRSPRRGASTQWAHRGV